MSAAFESEPVEPEPVASNAPLARNDFGEFVKSFEEAERGVRDGFALIAAAERRLCEGYNVPIPKPREHDAWGDPDGIKRVIDEMTRQSWGVLVDRLELRRILSIAEYKKLETDLRNEKWPPITVDNVRQFAAQFREKAPDMLKAAVLEIFEWLRPSERDHVHRLKTNTELEIGRKVILSGVIERPHPWSDSWRVNYHRSQHLVALERVFHALDGRGGISKHWQSEIQTAIERVSPKGATSLFKYHARKNGNLHLEFLRLDLLAKLNAVAGGKRLKPEAGSGWTKSDRSTRAQQPRPDARSGAERSEKELAFFATPPELADRIVELADINYSDKILEPSAGDGAIALAVRRAWPDRGHQLTCIEIHPARAAVLRALGFTVIEADFLGFDVEPTFDVIVANPPWTGRADAYHLAAMLRCLKPGGALVCVVSGSLPSRMDVFTHETRQAVFARGGHFEALPSGSFSDSGTEASAALCVVPRSRS